MKTMSRNFIFLMVILTTVFAAAVIKQKITSPSRPAGENQAVYYCSMHPTYTSDRSGDCPICNMKLVKKDAETVKESKAVYYCPMHPTYTSDRPGDCPICNMSLIKKEATPAVLDSTADSHAGHEEAGDELQSIKALTLKELLSMKQGEICLLHKCKMGTCQIAMTEEFARLGKCPHCGEDLNVIIKDFVKPEGYSEVRMGEEKTQLIGVKTDTAKKMPLTKTIRTAGRIAYDPELYQAEEEYLQALKAYQKVKVSNVPELEAQAGKLVDSAKIKLRLLGINDALIQELEAKGEADKTLLYSDAGSSVWLYAPVYEYEMQLVKVGGKIEAEAAAMPGKKFQGLIRAMDSVLDPVTRTVNVRAVLENPEGGLKPEMFVNAVIRVDLGEVLAVPEEAIFRTGERNILFVEGENHTLEPRQVVLGVQADRFYEIKQGVLEGETIVVSGNFLIDSESRLKAALESAISGGGHQHAV